MSSQQIVLLDFPSKEPLKAWNRNPWKTRFTLAYKGIDYRTEWVEYPDIRPKIEPHLPGLEKYTLPTVILPGGEYVMDSLKIAEALEAARPEPPLHLGAPVLQQVYAVQSDILAELVGVYAPLVPRRILNDASLPYWYRTREASFGMPLDRLAAERGGGDAAFERAGPPLRRATQLLRESSEREGGGEGPFFLGATVSFADFVWGAFLIFWRRLGDDVYQKILDGTGDRELHLRFLEGLKPWSGRDDH